MATSLWKGLSVMKVGTTCRNFVYPLFFLPLPYLMGSGKKNHLIITVSLKIAFISNGLELMITYQMWLGSVPLWECIPLLWHEESQCYTASPQSVLLLHLGWSFHCNAWLQGAFFKRWKIKVLMKIQSGQMTHNACTDLWEDLPLN